ncbi:MAG: LPS export ABC transporter periplasmic protein LptC [Alphaproteobacteria bacterium]
MTGPGGRRVPSLVALKGAARHSRIVRMMRVILPALALLVIGVVMLHAFMYKADDTLKLSFAETGPLADDLRMVQPEFSARFGENSPFRITSESAWRDENLPGRVVLNKIEADVNVDGVSWFTLSALKGVLDTEAAQVVLGGGIDLSSGLGYQLRTDALNIDLDKGTITGGAAVTGQGPMGTLRSDGFSVSGEGSRIRFEGNVRVTLLPAAPPSG